MKIKDLLDKICFKKAVPVIATPVVISEKDKATAAGLPWIEVLEVELDPDNIGNGAFVMDWNDIFVSRLIKAGYTGRTDGDIVDQWFQSVCQNVLAQSFEQEMADPEKRAAFNRKNIGNGRSEVY